MHTGQDTKIPLMREGMHPQLRNLMAEPLCLTVAKGQSRQNPEATILFTEFQFLILLPLTFNCSLSASLPAAK